MYSEEDPREQPRKKQIEILELMGIDRYYEYTQHTSKMLSAYQLFTEKDLYFGEPVYTRQQLIDHFTKFQSTMEDVFREVTNPGAIISASRLDWPESNLDKAKLVCAEYIEELKNTVY